METADQSLSKREECVSGLQAEIRELQGTSPGLDMVPETPSKNDVNNDSRVPSKSASYLEKFRESISKLELSADDHGNPKYQKHIENEISCKFQDVGADSSGVGLDSDLNFSDSESLDIPLRQNVNKCITDMSSPQKNKNSDSHDLSSELEYTIPDSGKVSCDLSESPIAKVSSDLSESPMGKVSSDLSESPIGDTERPLVTLSENQAGMNNKYSTKCNSMNFKNVMNKHLDYEIHRPLDDSRILQVILTPLKNKVIVKHTKSSMLRLKNSPVKDPTYGRECLRVKPLPRRSLHLEKENFYRASQIVNDGEKQKPGKRKCTEKENVQHDLNTSKKRKVVAVKKKQIKSKAKRSSSRQYNLRTRR